MTPRNIVVCGDALTVLRTLRSQSVSTVVTSPPYLLARHYGAGTAELGLETHVDDWVASLREVCGELWRVLRPEGSLFLNLGDVYSSHARLGAPRKSLLLAPERLLRALLDDGWTVRNKLIWAKHPGMPSPVRDRFTCAYEPVFFLVKQPSYWFDLDAVRVPLTSTRRPSLRQPEIPDASRAALASPRSGLARMAAEGRSGHALGKNPSDVWTLAPGRSVGAHPAVFPEALVRRPILATTPRSICVACDRPWRRSARRVTYLAGVPQQRPFVACDCGAPTKPGIVLDPFAGSGTTLAVARGLGRDAFGIELNPDFARFAATRAGLTGPIQGVRV